MSIAQAEDWLLAEIRRVAGPAFRSIESGPGQWSEDYLKRVVGQAPAIRVAYLESPAREESALTLDTRWAIYLLTGWAGGDERSRRRGRDGEGGVYSAAELLAPWLHRQAIPDVGVVSVTEVSNLWNGKLDARGLALFAIGLSIPIPLDFETGESLLADWLRAGVAWDLTGDGEAEAAGVIELRPPPPVPPAAATARQETGL